jgi:UDP-3-O-[3-hydroxymyristoyl] glucosamine N-acyltransferase
MDKILIFGDGSSTVQEAVDILNDCKISSEILTTSHEELRGFDFEAVGSKKVFFAINHHYLNYLRSGYLYQSKIRKHNIVNVIHPSAMIADDVSLGFNCLISYSAQIKAKTKIHNNVFINKAANLGVNVTIHENSWVGIDAKITSNTTIGCHTIIGDNTIIEAHSVSSFCELTKKATYKDIIKDHVSFIEEAQNPIYFL